MSGTSANGKDPNLAFHHGLNKTIFRDINPIFLEITCDSLIHSMDHPVIKFYVIPVKFHWSEKDENDKRTLNHRNFCILFPELQ